MMQPQPATTLLKPWPQTSSFGAHFREIVAKLKQVVEIPVGYEDETGFHTGVAPAQKDIPWPPA
jgi:hypothetical protein